MIVLALLGAACASEDGATSVRVAVAYDDALSLDEMRVEYGETSRGVPLRPEILVLLPEDAAGESLALRVVGIREGRDVAAGRTRVSPAPGVEVAARVVLQEIPCGAWCELGATRCALGGVQICEEDAAGCRAWSEPAACPEDRPSCSLGTCAEACVDECAEGDVVCDGPGAFRRCGEGDGDPCLDWLSADSCEEGLTCLEGRCQTGCEDECAERGATCRGEGIVRCGDRNRDGCLEWGPAEPCEAGASCEDGACVDDDACTDQCEVSTCDDGRFVRCGDFDFDDCLEPATPVACSSEDACLQGECSEDGCTTTPVACDSPPASECVDADTKRVWSNAGECVDGGCSYGFEDVPCPACPDCDPCAGVTCDAPPGPCYEPTGACDGGTCRYTPTSGGSCDDDDACTVGDVCSEGTCAGEPLECGIGHGIGLGPCRLGMCDPETGECTTSNVADGASCDDQNACTVEDRCEAGRCRGRQRILEDIRLSEVGVLEPDYVEIRNTGECRIGVDDLHLTVRTGVLSCDEHVLRFDFPDRIISPGGVLAVVEGGPHAESGVLSLGRDYCDSMAAQASYALCLGPCREDCSNYVDSLERTSGAVGAPVEPPACTEMVPGPLDTGDYGGGAVVRVAYEGEGPRGVASDWSSGSSSR